MICPHSNTVVSDMSGKGVSAEATVCIDCGAPVDCRPLSGLVSEAAVPPEELEIQASVLAAKQDKVEARLREESGEFDAMTENAVVSKDRQAQDSARWALCSKHGGTLLECDEGKRKAHHCRNSKWGGLRAFGGPCRCSCHAAKMI